MARSLDVADVPALLDAMIGWLDPADEPGNSALLRRWRHRAVPAARHHPHPVLDPVVAGLDPANPQAGRARHR